jgi:phosphatidylinositol-3-phosphatase
MSVSKLVRRKRFVGFSALAAGSLLLVGSSRAAEVQRVWVIALENHNWTVNGAGFNGSNLALENNPAAPYVNSLINGTNPLSTQTAYAQDYFASGTGVHPSEPNYIWAEAGTNFNPIATGTSTTTTKGTIIGATITTDADPSASANNIFSNVPHLTHQMNTAGVSWNNYQEDVGRNGQDATHSASGASGTNNPYYGTNQYNYAVKHNPMAFFTDTQTQNVKTFDQLRSDIANNTFAQYNWITPNQFNDMHSAITGGFTYHGTAYTGDQAAVAIGDNFLATIIPQITATQAYQNNGAIIIWNDETEGGDTSAFTDTEIVISPLAHPNVGGMPYGSAVSMNHSSDIKTMEEIFDLDGPIDNAINTSSFNTLGPGNFNTVAGSNDLSDLFAAGAVPEPAGLSVIGLSALGLLARRRRKI